MVPVQGNSGFSLSYQELRRHSPSEDAGSPNLGGAQGNLGSGPFYCPHHVKGTGGGGEGAFRGASRGNCGNGPGVASGKKEGHLLERAGQWKRNILFCHKKRREERRSGWGGGDWSAFRPGLKTPKVCFTKRKAPQSVAPSSRANLSRGPEKPAASDGDDYGEIHGCKTHKDGNQVSAGKRLGLPNLCPRWTVGKKLGDFGSRGERGL